MVEKLFGDNNYMLFMLLIYNVYMISGTLKVEKKIIILYTLMFLLTGMNDLEILPMLIVFIIITFIYYEFIIEDEERGNILNNLLYRMIDFGFVAIVQFRLLHFVLSALLVSSCGLNLIGMVLSRILELLGFIKVELNTSHNLAIGISWLMGGFILYRTIHFISMDPFKLNTYAQMYKKLMTKPGKNIDENINLDTFERVEPRLSNILIYREDRSFFEREKNYTIISAGFLKYIHKNIREEFDANISDYSQYSLSSMRLIFILKKYMGWIWKFIISIKSGHLYSRGYSVIEMQLIRTIGLANGYDKKIRRKLQEVVYSSLVFNGLKKYLRLHYNEVTDKLFKQFILTNYIHYARPVISEKRYINILDLFEKEKIGDLTNAEMFIGVLSLSGKVGRQSSTLISNKYFNSYSKFEITQMEIEQVINELVQKKRI